MKLVDTMKIFAGGPGSGCRGPNCGRPEGSGFRSGRRGSAIQRIYDYLSDGQAHSMSELESRFGKLVRNVPYRVQILAQYGRRQGNFEVRRSGSTVRLVPTSTSTSTTIPARVQAPSPAGAMPSRTSTTTPIAPPQRTSTTTPTAPVAPTAPVQTNTNPAFRKPVGFLTKAPNHLEYEQIRSKGIRISPDDIAKFEQAFKMNPVELKAQLLKGVPEEVASRLMFQINFRGGQPGEWDTELDGGGLRQSRHFDLSNGSVYHAYWRIPAEMQASGLGKTIFNNYLELYDHLGIKTIKVGANIDVGGYAWARYGFVPGQYSWDSIRRSVGEQADRITDPSLKARVKMIAGIQDPKAMWLLAGLKDTAPGQSRLTIGQQLLMGKSWDGKINLNDVENYGVVSSYVKPKETHAAAEPYGIKNGKKIDAPFHNNMLNSPDGEAASDYAAVGVALDHGWSLEDAVRWLVRSPQTAKEMLGELSAGGPGSGRKPGPTSRVVEIKKKPWKKQTEEERRYVAFRDPRQQQLFKEPTVRADKDGEPMVGNMSRKHFNKKEDFFVPKPGQKGGAIQATVVRRGSRHCVVSHTGKNLGCSPSKAGAKKRLAQVEYFKHKSMDADGEPGVPAAGYGVIEPLGVLKHAHPPSLKNPKRVPTDDPREDDDTFGDVTKRNSKETQKMRMDMLKRSIPGGNPPALPVTTTAIPHHTAVYQPGMGFAAQKPQPKVRLKQRPAQGMVKQQPGMPEKPKRTFIPYSRRGSA